MEIFQNRLAKT